MKSLETEARIHKLPTPLETIGSHSGKARHAAAVVHIPPQLSGMAIGQQVSGAGNLMAGNSEGLRQPT